MSAPDLVMFIRHGEKPGDDGPPHGINQQGESDPHSLSVRGWTRAGALAVLFANAPSAIHPQVAVPERVIATKATDSYKSKREVHTVTPLAKRLGLSIDDSFDHSQSDALVASVLGGGQSALIAWHHGSMPAVLGRFEVVNSGDIPKHWPEERFDLIWLLARIPDTQTYRFASVDQVLLDGDQDSAESR